MTEEINYIFKRNALSRSIKISVHTDGLVVVTAPLRVSKKFIEKFVSEKKEWINEKIEFFKVEGKLVKKSDSRKEYYQYSARARKLVHEKLKEINKIYNFSFGRVSIRHAKTRWGSCSKNGNLNFNYRIIFLPDHLVDYLIAHELCHLAEFNHSHRFWQLVEKAVPNCKIKAKELRKMS